MNKVNSYIVLNLPRYFTRLKTNFTTCSKNFGLDQAFGVGAYEEEDDDIYAQDSISNYDAIMGDERNPDETYGWTKPLAITSKLYL